MSSNKGQNEQRKEIIFQCRSIDFILCLRFLNTFRNIEWAELMQFNTFCNKPEVRKDKNMKE